MGEMGSSRKCFLLNVQEGALHVDAVLKLTRSFSGTKLAGTGCFSHNFLHKEQPEPIALFPMVHACTLFRRVLAYVMGSAKRPQQRMHRGPLLVQ